MWHSEWAGTETVLKIVISILHCSWKCCVLSSKVSFSFSLGVNKKIPWVNLWLCYYKHVPWNAHISGSSSYYFFRFRVPLHNFFEFGCTLNEIHSCAASAYSTCSQLGCSCHHYCQVKLPHEPHAQLGRKGLGMCTCSWKVSLMVSPESKNRWDRRDCLIHLCFPKEYREGPDWVGLWQEEVLCLP